MAYESLLDEAGRQRQILPFMGKVYTGVFGEVPKNIPNNTTFSLEQTQTKQGTVIEMLTKYRQNYPNWETENYDWNEYSI